MPSVSSPRTVFAAIMGIAALVGSAGAGVSGALTQTVQAATPAKVVTAIRITRRPGTLAPGTRIRAAGIFGQRVFTDAKHGFALASVPDADYPVATADGGKTWRTDGPALHLHAAQAPLAVTFIGAVNRQTVFAWGGGQVIDATSNGGKTWYSALFTEGGPTAVVRDLAGRLVALIGSPNGSPTWEYVSKDAGRSWHYRGTVRP